MWEDSRHLCCASFDFVGICICGHIVGHLSHLDAGQSDRTGVGIQSDDSILTSCANIVFVLVFTTPKKEQ